MESERDRVRPGGEAGVMYFPGWAPLAAAGIDKRERSISLGASGVCPVPRLLKAGGGTTFRNVYRRLPQARGWALW